MSNILTSKLTKIASAIRVKTSGEGFLTLDEMVKAIDDISVFGCFSQKNNLSFSSAPLVFTFTFDNPLPISENYAIAGWSAASDGSQIGAFIYDTASNFLKDFSMSQGMKPTAISSTSVTLRLTYLKNSKTGYIYYVATAVKE